VRYERLLTAWTELIGRLDEQVRLNCLADYAHPTLRAAWDIPLTFKDQLAKGIVILEHLAVGDDSMLAYNNHHRGGYYRSELGKLADDTPALEQIQDYLNNDLYSSDEAQHLRDMHGVAFHDTSASPMSGKRTLAKLDDGLYVTIIDKPIDLKTELETIDRQRRRLRRGYELFNERASSLYESLIGQQTPND